MSHRPVSLDLPEAFAIIRAMTSSGVILKQAEIGPMANFIYVIGCPETREAAVVDPAWDTSAIARMAQESDLRITRIFLTHGHPDHVNRLEELLEATDAKVYVNAEETDYMKQCAAYFNMPIEFMKKRSVNFQMISDGEEALVGKVPVRFLHTPGHTPGSQCFLVDGNLVSGDTLFINACGRVDLPGGDPEKMWWSLNHRLRALDDDTVLYPGHNYASVPRTTMGEQKLNNRYLCYTSLESFLVDMRAY
jgi:hydroxyacylglutathione hydrolase